jgi:hypothetical protein
MSVQLLITTSNGVYCLDDKTGSSRCIMSNKHTPGFFKKRAHGYFGICYHPDSSKVIVSSREKLGTRKHNKPTTDTKLHAIDTTDFSHCVISPVKDVHDAHQIFCNDNYIFITDTGKNRVVVFDVSINEVIKIINIGKIRKDIHHVNAVLVHSDHLYIGISDKVSEKIVGRAASSILRIHLNKIFDNSNHEIDALHDGHAEPLKNTSNSHDLEVCDNQILCCSSHNGKVMNIETSSTLISEDGWIRGLAANEHFLWVGNSFIASRKDRHKRSIDGKLNKYDLKTFEKVDNYTLIQSGQINDVIIINKSST